MQLGFWQRSRWLSVGCLLAIRERRGQETQSMMLAEVVQRNPKQLADECAQGKRATIGVRFFGAEGTQYALSTILARQTSADLAGPADTAAPMHAMKVRTREGDDTAAQAQAGADDGARVRDGQQERGAKEKRGMAGDEGNFGVGTQQHSAAGSSPQVAAAAAALARLDVAAEGTPPPPPPPHGTGPSTSATPEVAQMPDSGEKGRASDSKSDAQRMSTASEAELPLLVDAVQVAHDFGVCKPVLQALQEDRLLAPPFGDTLFTDARQQPQTGHVTAPIWQNDESMAPWLQKRLETMDPAQQRAFDHALSHKVALIQGPPGSFFFHKA